jgi:hypothetical protein
MSNEFTEIPTFLMALQICTTKQPTVDVLLKNYCPYIKMFYLITSRLIAKRAALAGRPAFMYKLMAAK